MKVPQLFVPTRWLSKSAMIYSMLENKEHIDEMVAEIGIDPDMDSLAEHVLTDQQWELMQVCLLHLFISFISLSHLLSVFYCLGSFCHSSSAC
jgi:hypothetical protein